MPRDRERAHHRFGEDAQEVVRRRVQGQPQRVSEYPLDEEEQKATREQLDRLFGDATVPDRRFLHLKEVVILPIPAWADRSSRQAASVLRSTGLLTENLASKTGSGAVRGTV